MVAVFEVKKEIPTYMSAIFPNFSLSRAALKTACTVALLTLFLGLVLAVVFWMPGAMYDDTFFSGPAIQFARTGQMTSFLFDWDPLQHYTDRPFWYPPIFFYVFGSWLRLFGCSTASALCFYATLAAVSSAGFSLMLSRFDCPPYWCFASSIISWTTFYSATLYGLRPEPLALAFLFMGLPLIASCRTLLQCAGFCFSGLAIFTAPRTGAWVLAFGGLAVIGALSSRHTVRQMLLVSRNAIIGVLGGFLIFLFSIDFNWSAFSQKFFATLALKSPSFASGFELGLHFFVNGFAKLNWLGVLTLLLSGVIASVATGPRLAILPLTLTYLLGIILALGTGAIGTVIFLYLATLGIWGIQCSSSSLAIARRLIIIACALFAFIPLIINAAAFYESRFNEPDKWTHYRKIAAEVESRSWREVWIDHFSLRYVFDFKPPSSARAATLHLRELAENPVPQDNQTSYVLSRSVLFEAAPGKFTDQPGMKIMGRTFLIRSGPEIVLITKEYTMPPSPSR